MIAGSAELRDRAGTAALAPDPPAAARVVVLGIGNTLLTDEALGIQAVERFAAMYRVPDHVQLIDGGTSAMELLDVVADCELLIVVDALLANSTPGSVVRLAADADAKTIEAAALAGEKVRSRTAGKTVIKVIVVPRKLVNLVVK